MATTLTIPGSSSPCAACQAIPWPSLPLGRPFYNGAAYGWGGASYATFQALQDSADQGCPLCQYFWIRLANDVYLKGKKPGDLLALPVKLDIRLLKDKNLDHDGSSTYISMIARIETEQFHSGFSKICLLKPASINEVACQVSNAGQRIRRKCVTTAKENQDFPLNLKPEFDETNISQELEDIVEHEIKPWMENCCQQRIHHEKCGFQNGGLGKYLLPDKEKLIPRRYLDLGGSREHLVKLVDLQDLEPASRGEYLILSYCWGAGNATAKTTKGNLRSRYEGLDESTLPKTIRDAIKLTRLMGFRYLWVDAICIVQSLSHDDQGEFQEEAKRMGGYYANAACCISASRASDSCEGFLCPRPYVRYPLQPIVIQLTTSTESFTQTAVFMEGDWRDEIMANHTRRSPLMQRGWYLQELLLSRRILHWTEFGLYRECRSSWFAEGRTMRWEAEHPDILENPRDCMGFSEDGKLTSAGWYNLLAIFSGRRLTFPEDRQHALLGVASLFAQDLGDGYVHGLFPSSLAEGLAWRSALFSEEERKTPRQDSFPGWSWASNGKVWFSKFDQNASYAQIHKPYLASASHSFVTTSANHSKLLIRAPLITVKLGGKGDIQIQGTHQIEATGIGWPDHTLGLAPALVEAIKRARIPGAILQWVLLGHGEFDGRRGYYGLLVQRVPDSEEGTYGRYGFLELNYEGIHIEDCFDELTDLILV